MFKNIAPQVMDDLLADDIGMLDLIAQADGGIQGGKQCQPAVKSHAAHILRRDAHVHDAQEKLRNQHGKGGSGQHHHRHGEEAFPVRL